MSQVPGRTINPEFLSKLELVSDKIFPLPGASVMRGNYLDPRIRNWNIPGLSNGEKVCLYEHIATVRHQPSDTFFVAFRQTMDCLLIEQKDPDKYPEWLMKSEAKKTELSIHIYQVRMINGIHVMPKNLVHMNSHEDWLQEIPDAQIFETVATFLLKNDAVNIASFKRS